MIKSRKIKIFSALGVITIAIILSISFFVPAVNANAAEKRIDKLMNEVEYRVNESLESNNYSVNGLPLALSSNPYDYIENNDMYDKLTALGKDHLNELYALQSDSEKYSSLERYIIAIAIEDITKVDLKTSEKYFWEDADSFSNSWIKLNNEAEKDIQNILNDSTISKEEKIEKICFYGTLAEDIVENANYKKLSKENLETINEAINTINNSSRSKLVELSKPTQ